MSAVTANLDPMGQESISSSVIWVPSMALTIVELEIRNQNSYKIKILNQLALT